MSLDMSALFASTHWTTNEAIARGWPGDGQGAGGAEQGQPRHRLSEPANRSCGYFALRHIDLGGSFSLDAAIAYLATWPEVSQLLTHWSGADQLHKEIALPGARVKGPRAVDRRTQDPRTSS